MIGRNIFVLLAGGMAVSGCATLGGNVKGDFACRAPVGTCAPMTSIDAAAVAQVKGDEPAGSMSTSNQATLSAAASATPLRSGERAITIMLPAYVDEAGILHESATVHAVVEPSGWTMASTGRSTSSEISRGVPPSPLREAIAGASAPAIEGLESLPAQAPHALLSLPVTGVPQATAMPSASAVAAARAGHRIGTSPTVQARSGPAVLPRGKVQLPAGDAAVTLKRVRALAAPAMTRPSRAPAVMANTDGDPGDPFGSPTGQEQPQ